MKIERLRSAVAEAPTGARTGGPAPGPVVAAVGNFDGVHRGHQEALRLAGHEAAVRGAELVAVTFEPHPARLLRPGRAPGAIMSLALKAEALADLGVGRLVVLEFTEALARVSPAAFVKRLLVDRLGVIAVVQGQNFRFGRDRSGGLPCLKGLGKRHGFAVIEAPTVTCDGETVSSTRIRRALALRDLDLARAMLGRPYEVEGSVVPGRGRGRRLGFPTANLVPAGEFLLPHGVYSAEAELPAGSLVRRFRAVIHHGPRPTFRDSVSLEAHLIGFAGALESLRLRPDSFLREIRSFDGPEALQRQLARDAARATDPFGLASGVRPPAAEAMLAGS